MDTGIDERPSPGVAAFGEYTGHRTRLRAGESMRSERPAARQWTTRRRGGSTAVERKGNK